jgi:cysteine synthase
VIAPRRTPELPIAAPYHWPDLVPLPAGIDRDWAQQAINLLQGDGRRSADTHLVKPAFRGLRGISMYLKDESTHPTGSLKHRLARSLFLYGICNGRIGAGTTLVEASPKASSARCRARPILFPTGW